jgi:hypothetical protein
MASKAMQALIDKLNKIENVRVHKETGAILMKSEDGVWNILCTTGRFLKSDNHEIYVDYDNLRIGLINKDDKSIKYIASPESLSSNEKITLFDKRLTPINTTNFLGVVDDVKYTKLPDTAYYNGNDFYDCEMNKIATGSFVIIKSTVQSIQHVHIFDGIWVLCTRKTVTVDGPIIIIGDENPAKYCILLSIQSDKYYLINREIEGTDDKIIPLENYYNFAVGETEGEFLYRGFKIPEFDGYEVFEIDGVWLGRTLDSKFVPLEPIMPKSGAKTKAALPAN